MAVVFDPVRDYSPGGELLHKAGSTAASTRAATARTRLRGRVEFTLAFAGVYSLFCWALYEGGHLGAQHNPSYFAAALAGWALGFLVIVLCSRSSRVSEQLASLTLALWSNIGMVATAVLFGGELRILLLVGTVFGVLYGALHLNRDGVRMVTLATLITYACAITFYSQAVLIEGLRNPGFEWVSALVLVTLTLSGLLVANEVVRIRERAQRRNGRLSNALRRVEELALRDELTGLYNRRHLLDFVQRQLASVDRGGASFTLCYCDLDYFKRVNDLFGHKCGDDLLRAFSREALRCVRAHDLVARLGGEEFVLVLVDADLDEASLIVERLRQHTASLPVHPNQPDYRVTLSVGVTANRVDDTVDSILRRADKALYQAKETGRDCMVRG